MNFIIEGLDRTGKDTLIKNLLNHFGFMQVIHYQRPKMLKKYESASDSGGGLHKYQRDCFWHMFSMLKGNGFILNRSHIGEVVYAPRYRNYSGDYVFALESEAFKTYSYLNTLLILLVEDIDNAKHFKDDGESFTSSLPKEQMINARKQEQQAFIDAFNKSAFRKCIIKVTDDNGEFKNEQQILNEVLECLKYMK